MTVCDVTMMHINGFTPPITGIINEIIIHNPIQSMMDKLTDNQPIACHSDDPSLIAQFVVETYTFRTSHYSEEHLDIPNQPGEINVTLRSASTTRGRSLIIPGYCDSTGIMIWPASYLLCQFLCYRLSSNTPLGHCHFLGVKILELGCGIGIVGITAALTSYACRPEDPLILFSTDVAEDVLQLCTANIQRNDLSHNPNVFIAARKLSWGQNTDITAIMEEAGLDGFDSVIAADIVYPTTTDETLSLLFKTVDQALKIGGSFFLSFVSRDGFKTPRRFVQASSQAKYKIEYIPYKDFIKPNWANFLHPLLDATLLLLTRDEHAHIWNDQLGSDDCLIFPGMKRASLASRDGVDVKDEWIAPECFDY